jgi:hypothetical protein
MSSGVLAVLKPVLADLGAEDDPECWVAWGEDPDLRYPVMVGTLSGLVFVTVRANGGEEGPRATGKLIHWSRMQLSELSVEAAGGHRLVAVQVEGQVLKGVDEQADMICEFVLGLIAGIDGRTATPVFAVVPGMPVYAAPAQAAVASTAAPKAAKAKGPKPAPPKVATPEEPEAAEPEEEPIGVAALTAAAEPMAEAASGADSPVAGPARSAGARRGARAGASAPVDKSSWVAPHPIGGPAPAAPSGPASAPAQAAQAAVSPPAPVAKVPTTPLAAAAAAARAAAAAAAAAAKAPAPAAADQPAAPAPVEEAPGPIGWELPEHPAEPAERKPSRPRWTP